MPRILCTLLAAAVALFATAAVVHSGAEEAAAAKGDWKKAKTDPEFEAALDALAASDHPDAARVLIEVIKTDPTQGGLRPPIREKAWQCLARLRDPEAVQAVLAALNAIDSQENRRNAFQQFELLYGLVTNKESAPATEAVRAALTTGGVWRRTAALEAVRAAEVAHPGCGARFLPEVLALLGSQHSALHAEPIFTVNVLAAVPTLARKSNTEDVVNAVTGLVAWQEWSGNENVRLRDLADRALLALTGEDCTLKPDTVSFWKWWLHNRAEAAPDAPQKQSRTAPVIFREPIVGTRTVFVIDTSDSMKWEIEEADRDRLAKLVPHLNWKVIRTPLDLAIAELVHSIGLLQQARPPKKSGGKNKTASIEEQDYPHFAIVTYNRDVEFLTGGWVPATKSKCRQWIKEVQSLSPRFTTNIHGAFLAGMGINRGSGFANFPDLDPNCLLHGAHTMVFLTDGFATWSNDSNDRTATDQYGNPTGDGEYVKRDSLLTLARHINRFRHVVINTVGIGVHDAELMRGFAKDSGGSYTDWSCRIKWQ
jgi:hypothetical protein